MQLTTAPFSGLRNPHIDPYFLLEQDQPNQETILQQQSPPTNVALPILASLNSNSIPQEIKVIKRRRKPPKPSDLSCAKCPNMETSQWYTNKEDPTTYVCKSCYMSIYMKKKHAEATANGITCDICSTTETSQWCIHPSFKDTARKVCRTCYNALINAINKEAAEGALCLKCSRKNTHRWHNIPNSTAKLCEGCYLKSLREEKKSTPNPSLKKKRTRNLTKELAPLARKKMKQLPAVQNPLAQAALDVTDYVVFQE